MYKKEYSTVLNPATTSPWAYQLGYFSNQECNAIIEQGLVLPSSAGDLGAEKTVDNAIRRSRVSFFSSLQQETAWIFKRIHAAVDTFNKQFWNFDLTYLECIQFSRYDVVEDFYAAHMDMYYNELDVRKLSISVQLSDPDTYQGSDLRLFNSGKTFTSAPRERGTIIVFPSYLVHEVTALTSGARFSLVSWIKGPPFK